MKTGTKNISLNISSWSEGWGVFKILVGFKLPVEFVFNHPHLAVVMTPAASPCAWSFEILRIAHIHVRDGKHQAGLRILECLDAV